MTNEERDERIKAWEAQLPAIKAEAAKREHAARWAPPVAKSPGPELPRLHTREELQKMKHKSLIEILFFGNW